MKNKFASIIVCIFCFIIFYSWFSFYTVLSSGDWPYFHKQAVKSFSFTPSYYKEYWGLGETKAIFTPLETYFQWSAKIVSDFLPWEISEKIFWYFPFLLISFFSAKAFSKSLLGGLIYTTNTYILMVVSGGQMGVALAYAIAPYVIKLWIELIDKREKSISENLYQSLLVGLFLSLQVFFDPRIATISLGVVVLYYIYSFFVIYDDKVIHLKKISYSFAIPGVVIVLLHSLWILPMVLYRVGTSDYGDASNSSQGILDFFSFSDFSHMISLLHPNWPENIFGKVYFLQPEFLLIPLLVFSSLFLYAHNIKTSLDSDKKNILFFCFVGLLGAFLAKGVNEPFGAVYKFFYEYFPGFIVFRDPTKFMLLIALAYAYIIPKTVMLFSTKLHLFLQKREKNISFDILHSILLIMLVLLWGFLVRQAVFAELRGTFHNQKVPLEYNLLASFISKDPAFFRVLWVPVHQRFGYYGNDHPAISAEEFFHTSDRKKLLALFKKPETPNLLRESAVKYIVIPSDSRGEIFLTDRKYDGKKFNSFRERIKKIPGLNKVATFGSIDVYELISSKNHIWMQTSSGKPSFITWRQISPTRYIVSADAQKGDTVIFSENYSRFWRVRVNGETFAVSQYKKLFFSYKSSANGLTKIEFFHVFEEILPISTAISIVSSIVLLVSLFLLRKQVYKK